jgi:3'(2'), 5'-bisphosphate nucleotidase
MPHTYDREREVAIEAIRTAARVCRSVQATITPDVLEKQDRSPVTVADFASQAIICRALAEAFPADPVVGQEDSAELRTPENAPFLDRIREELAQVGIDAGADEICAWIDHNSTIRYSDRFWTLDPIDGTKGFLRKAQYAIALALIVDGRIDVALLGCPNLALEPGADQPVGRIANPSHGEGAIFCAVRGRGSRIIPLDGEPVES